MLCCTVLIIKVCSLLRSLFPARRSLAGGFVCWPPLSSLFPQSDLSTSLPAQSVALSHEEFPYTLGRSFQASQPANPNEPIPMGVAAGSMLGEPFAAPMAADLADGPQHAAASSEVWCWPCHGCGVHVHLSPHR